MRLYKRADSPYWWVRFETESGVQRISTRLTDKGAATKKAVEIYTRAGGVRESIGFMAAADRYHNEVAKHQPSGTQTHNALKRMAQHFGKRTPLSGITTDEITAYIASRRDEVSNDTINWEVGLLRRLWRRASGKWRKDVGEMPDWSELTLPTKALRARHLTDEEEARLWDAVRSVRPEMESFIRFALLSGQRFSSVAGLRWSDVDLAARAVRFRVKSRKPGGDFHVCPLTKTMVSLLKQEQSKHPDYVFTVQARITRGNMKRGDYIPITRASVRPAWEKALGVAGLEDFCFHDLRHTAGTRMQRTTGNLRITQQFLGHKSLRSTARYTHVESREVLAAMKAITGES